MEVIQNFDSSIVTSLQSAAGDSFLDKICLYLSNGFTWTPLFVFLALMVFQYHIGRHWLVLLFGIGAFVIAYQAATFFSFEIMRQAPFFAMSGQSDASIFIKRGEHPFSLPDWGIASISAACFYTAFLLNTKIPTGLKWLIIFIPLVMALARMEKGLCYPTDVLAGYMVGLASAFLLSRFPEHMDLLLGD